MSRSPLSYPLNRAADTDAGGAADLQTDIMRFMAILSLCLVAIFALVQSIPMAPVQAVEPADPPPPVNEPVPSPQPAPAPAARTSPAAASPAALQPVVLTRPKWVPKYPQAQEEPVATRVAPATLADEAPPTDDAQVASEPVPPAAPPPAEQQGFTLRFASDVALTRAVAAHHVGLYALQPGRAKRMTVSESRISFWDASTPKSFHEMETHTVPVTVIEALARTGVETASVNWGVTLPGRMTSQLEALMREHRGGSLIIDASGDIHWEAS